MTSEPVYPPQPPAVPQPNPGPPAVQRRGNPLGIVAIILVVAAVLVRFVITLAAFGLYANLDFDAQAYGALIAASSWLAAVVAIGAVVVGAIGVAAKDRPRILAAIGLGGGAVIVVETLLGFVQSLALSAF